jgi:hypothetical protein
MQSERFRRQVLKKTFMPKDEEALIDSSVFFQYEKRMLEYVWAFC